MGGTTAAHLSETVVPSLLLGHIHEAKDEEEDDIPSRSTEDEDDCDGCKRDTAYPTTIAIQMTAVHPITR
jgi:hypothetical protein